LQFGRDGVILAGINLPTVSDRSDRFNLRALLETSRLLASSLEPSFVFNSLLLSTMSKLLVTRGVIMLDDPLGGGFRTEATKGRLPAELGQGKLLKFSAPDALVEADAVPQALRDAGIALLIPITYHERRIGLLGLGPKATAAPFDNDERSFVEALVHMSATAVHNAWVVEELQQANQELGQKVQQLHTLFDVAQGFTAAPSVDRATRVLALTLMGQFMVQRFAVFLRSDAHGAGLELAAGRVGSAMATGALSHLAKMTRLVLLDEEAPEELVPVRDEGFALAIPLRMQDVTRGILLLGPKASGQPYDAEDVDLLTALGQLALTAIENARGIEARLENQRIEEELRLAREIQERLLPRKLPAIEGIELAALNLPSRYVAGDYYDALALDKNRLLVAVGDVSGKGLPASLLMANLQACFHVVAASLAERTVELSTATSRVNRVIHRNTSITTFITFFWGLYDREGGVLRYVNAGHNPPLLIRKSGDVETLDEGGVLLGVLADAPYAQGEVRLEPGDVVALYTDGITEAWSVTNPDDEFGEERLLAVLRQAHERPAAAILDELREAVRTHTSDGPLDDDLTVVILCRRDDQPASPG
jgi:phosphoserine phosphatase RsbU/P